MQIPPDTITRPRTVQEKAYTDSGLPAEAAVFQMPRPFTEELLSSVAAALNVSAAGLANQMNQVLAENLGNNIAAKIKAAVAKKEALPTQADLDAMVESYDFSGVRTSSKDEDSLAPLERTQYRYAAQKIRALLKAGAIAIEGMNAPVTVAKKEAEPKANQISYDQLYSFASQLVEGESVWGETPEYDEDGNEANFGAVRATVLEAAAAEYAAAQRAATTMAKGLSMSVAVK